MQKGKHTKVDGPVKSFIGGCGVVALVGGGVLIYGSDPSGLAWLAGGAAALWIASKIPSKNRVEW